MNGVITVTLMYDTAVCALDFSECGDGACILGLLTAGPHLKQAFSPHI